MSMLLPTARYYPKLSEIVTVSELPEFLSFVQDGLNAVFDKIHYKNLQFSKSHKGDSAFYKLDIVSNKKIKLSLPFGVSLVLNPDYSGGDSNISSFPISLQYQWEILAFVKAFSIQNFSFSVESLYQLGLEIFQITEDQVLAHTLNYFVEPANPTTSKYQQVVDDTNTLYGFSAANNNLLQLPSGVEPSVDVLINAIKQHPGIDRAISLLLFSLYISDESNATSTGQNLQKFYNKVVPEGIEAYVRRIITPKAKASFELSAAVEFPRTLLQPVYDEYGHSPYNATTGTPFTVIPADATGSPKALLKFAEATFYADTEQGLGYSMDIALSTTTPVQIANTPLILFLHNLKLDLSKTKNLAEVNLDGRPPDFMGVYIQDAMIGFPPFWNHNPASTAVIKGRNLIIGTGGISGIFSLESTTNTGNDAALFRLGNPAVDKPHFELGLQNFFIEFKQNAIVQSEISGYLKIPGFHHDTGTDAKIGVKVHIGNNGDFRITATEADHPYTVGIKDIFMLALRSVSIGRERDKWFIEAAGSLTITAEIPHVTSDFLKQPIDIKRLRIYEDSSIEFVGGGITLPTNIHFDLGPVSLAMDHISFSSHEGAFAGNNRQYFCFGFSGSLQTGGGSINVRGDGVEFHFTRDALPLHTYLRIAGIGVDIKIPGNATKENADVLISGYLGIRHGNNTNGNALQEVTEYQGAVLVDLKKLKIKGKAAMNMRPQVPAWLVDMELELGTPLPLGATGLGIYGFRGLIGSHYAPSKTHIGLREEDTWYDYLKKKDEPNYGTGISKEKFDSDKPGFFAGLGATIATMGDDGWAFSSKVFILLSMPDMFLMEGKANVLHKRLGINTEEDPPFYAFLVVDSQSIQAGLGINYKLPHNDDTDDGKILHLRGEMQMAYFFGNSSAWYINIGKDLPTEKRIQARLFRLFDAYAYLMLNNRGIKAGAGAKFELQRKFGPVRVGLYAFIDASGFISFKPVQIGGAIQLGGGVYIKVGRFGVELQVSAGLSAEAPKPFVISGFIELKLKILFAKIKIRLEFTWIFNQNLNTDPIKLLDTDEFTGPAAKPPFKAISMLSEEAFPLKYVGDNIDAIYPDDDWNKYIIPMDSFIDLEFKRPVKPYTNRLGGGASPLPQFVEHVAPQKSRMPQVKHSFIVEDMQIKIFSRNNNGWEDYDPWEALTAAFTEAGLSVNTTNFPKGFWQYNNNPGKYTSLRLLAQSPFAVSNGTPPENFGLLAEHLFCAGKPVQQTCQYWREIARTKVYEEGAIIRDRNLLLQFISSDGSIGSIPNVFGVQPSLKIKASATLEIYFPEPVTVADLRLTSLTGVTISYYRKAFTGGNTPSGLPNYGYQVVQQTAYSMYDLMNVIRYDDASQPISKVVVETNSCYGHYGEDTFYGYWSQLITNWQSAEELPNAEQAQVTEWLETYGTAGNDANTIAIIHLCEEWKQLLNDNSLTDDERGIVNTWLETYHRNTKVYATALGELCGAWDDILAQPEAYPNLYTPVLAWKNKYCISVNVLDEFDTCSTYLHEACWLTAAQAAYNTLLQQNNQTAINAGATTLAAAINTALPPIWRPDSNFALVVKTRDEITAEGTYNHSDISTFVLGFKTDGPIGFFHTTQAEYAQLEDNNKADQYKLSSLRHYVDYQRSYPNADGQLLNAKPLYYQNPKLGLFFTKPYVYEFFTQWRDYKGTGDKEYRLIAAILDPVDKTNTPVIELPMGWQLHMGQQSLPIAAADIETISNVLLQGDRSCVHITTSLKPPTMNAEVAVNELLPSKLYRAVFKANEVTGTRKAVVHAYSFQTSKYRNFTEHIQSYIRKMRDVDTGQEVTKEAVFSSVLPYDKVQVDEIVYTLKQLVTHTLPANHTLVAQYATAYDRIVSGILRMQALQAPTDLELNIIYEKAESLGTPHRKIKKAIGILVKSPEPFNDPKLPDNILQNSLSVDIKFKTRPTEDPGDFYYYFSKDNSCVFITMTEAYIPAGTVKIHFTQKQWNGVSYESLATVPIQIEIEEDKPLLSGPGSVLE